MEQLEPGIGYSQYLWSNGATTQTITVSTSSNCSVTVTSSQGCKGSDVVGVTFTFQSMTATALVSPKRVVYPNP